MNNLYYIFSNIKLRELKKVKSFNVLDMIKDREYKLNAFKYTGFTEDQFEEMNVVNVIDGNESLFLEYLRKLLIERIDSY